jgi:ribonuclease R
MEAERDTIDRYVAAWLAGRVGEVFETRVTGVQSFGLFVTIAGLGGVGLVPVSTHGAERFAYDVAARALVGEQSGERYAIGRILDMRLAEANPLTGALKFEPPESAGRVEPRGRRPAVKEKGKFAQGRRGRPGNVRHQGRKR